MIVYYLTTNDRLLKLMSEGLQRAEGRFFVFAEWSLIQILLEAMAQGPDKTRDEIFEKHKGILQNPIYTFYRI